MSKVYGWDLNVWNVNDGSLFDVEDEWKITAYPFDAMEEIIGGHNVYASLTLNDEEVDHLRLGQSDNVYDDGGDFWLGCDYFIQEFDVPLRILEWLESLPTDSSNISIEV